MRNWDVGDMQLERLAVSSRATELFSAPQTPAPGKDPNSPVAAAAAADHASSPGISQEEVPLAGGCDLGATYSNSCATSLKTRRRCLIQDLTQNHVHRVHPSSNSPVSWSWAFGLNRTTSLHSQNTAKHQTLPDWRGWAVLGGHRAK